MTMGQATAYTNRSAAPQLRAMTTTGTSTRQLRDKRGEHEHSPRCEIPYRMLMQRQARGRKRLADGLFFLEELDERLSSCFLGPPLLTDRAGLPYKSSGSKKTYQLERLNIPPLAVRSCALAPFLSQCPRVATAEKSRCIAQTASNNNVKSCRDSMIHSSI